LLCSQTPTPTPLARPFARLSVVVPNYNYGRYLGDAVSSALALDWPDVQVVVVDDGSTDDSLHVLEGFGDRITVLQQENSGPRVACNRGFAASTGDAVLFLDSDDVVDPALARRAAEVWRPGVTKVQFQMHRIDAEGKAQGRPFPAFSPSCEPSPADVRRWMTSTGEYPTPPGSGNLYARSYLDRLLPLDDRCGDATDSACLAAAPYLGDVLTVGEPLVGYRVHGDNRSSLRSDPSRFTRQIERAWQRHDFARELSGQQPPGPAGALPALRRGRHLLQMRVAQARVAPEPPPLPGDTRVRLTWDALRSPWSPGPDRPAHRLAAVAWCLATLAAPLPLARRLVGWRFP
jgi:hypothetical protein